MEGGAVTIKTLRTGVNRPMVHSKWVSPPRLISRLDEDLNRHATLVSAPAGYGKTTVAAQRRNRLPVHSARPLSTKWTMNLGVFLSCVFGAIGAIVWGFGCGIEPLFSSPTLPTPVYLAEAMVSELEGSPLRPSGYRLLRTVTSNLSTFS